MLETTKDGEEEEVKLRPTASRLVCLDVGLPSGTSYRIFLFSLTIAGSLMLGTLSNERMGPWFTSTVTSEPCQSNHSGVQVSQNSHPHFTVSFETLPTWRARSPYLYPSGTGWPNYTPRNLVAFRHVLRLAGLRWRYCNPPPDGSKTVIFLSTL
jgi:hypothetical protein